MSWKLALDYIRALIWPCVVLTLGAVFRKQISSLFGRLDEVDTPVGKASFKSQADRVAKAAEDIGDEIAAELSEAEEARGDAVLTSPAPTGANQDSTLPVADNSDACQAPTDDRPVGLVDRESWDDLVSRFNSERRVRKGAIDVGDSARFAVLRSRSDVDPSGAVMSAWEEVLRALQAASPIRDSHFRQSAKRLLQEISRQGAIGSEVVRLADDLLQLRNEVAHGNLIVSSADARAYVTATKRVIDALALAQSPMARALQYEDAVLSELHRLSFEVVAGQNLRSEIDALVPSRDGRLVAVNVKYRSIGRQLHINDIRTEFESVRRAGDLAGVLIVVNTPVSDEIYEFARGQQPSLAVVTWDGPRDNQRLMEGLSRLSVRVP